jgi:hypothetical protein
MSRLTSYLAIAAFAVTSAVSAATFEGKVEMTISANGFPPQPITYQVRDQQLRMDMALGQPGAGTTLIMDWKKQQIMVVVEQQQMYMTRPMPTMLDTPDPQGGAAAKAQLDQSFVDTGKTEKVLGYTCKQYTTTSNGVTTRLWLTDQLGLFKGLGGEMSGNRSGNGMQAWEKALKGKEAFPLRVVGTDASGKEKYHLEVTSIIKQSLPDSTFEPPADYKPLNIADMMGMPH